MTWWKSRRATICRRARASDRSQPHKPQLRGAQVARGRRDDAARNARVISATRPPFAKSRATCGAASGCTS